jgi:hypothetical protein
VTPDGEGQATLELPVSGNGAVVVDVALDDPLSGQRLDARSNAVAIDVIARAAILYVQGSAGPLAPSLLPGGWTLNVVPATRADAYADRVDGYQAVVLDDVAISDAVTRFWSSLVAAVQERGLGLMVLGGERSFTRGGYRESALESVLPVLSEPAALDQSASVVFVVDKSGSTGQGIGVDRFRLAQRAVRETARTLTERDSLGLVVFDVEPRVLIPLGPARIATASVERDWQASPGGGTRLVPALEVAIGELERSDAARRMLVVVTDGFIDNASLAEVRARLDRSRIETIVLALGPDADVTALARLVGQDARSVVRVNEAAELPLAMRSTIRAAPGSHRPRNDCGETASALAVPTGKPERLATCRGIRRDALASARIGGGTVAAWRSVACVPHLRPRPRGCPDLWVGTLEPAMDAVARVAAPRRWSDRLDQRHVLRGNARARAARHARRSTGRRRRSGPNWLGRPRRRFHGREDADRASSGSIDGLRRVGPAAGDAARRWDGALHLRRVHRARLPARAASAQQSRRSGDMGHQPCSRGLEKRGTRPQL